MGEAVALFGVSARALRYYEDRGLIEPCRDRNNVRYFDALARQRLGWITALRRAGVSISAIETILDTEDHGLDGRASAIATLEARRLCIQATLAVVDDLLLAFQDAASAPPPLAPSDDVADDSAPLDRRSAV